jgi:hypothetical protein
MLERFGKEHRTIMKFRRFLLGQRRPDQIVLYKLIKAFLDNGQVLCFFKKASDDTSFHLEISSFSLVQKALSARTIFRL